MPIVKVLSRHSPSYKSLITYILRGRTDTSPIFTQNLRSDTIDGYTNEFIENELFRKQNRTDQVYLYHEIISFSAEEDKYFVAPAVIDDIAKEYIRLRGRTGVMIGAVHRDKEHVHLHFCISALQFRTGISFGLSKAAMYKLKMELQQYHQQKYPDISHSAPQHGKGGHYLTHGQWYGIEKKQKALKVPIIKTVQRSLETAVSQQDFFSKIKLDNIRHSEEHGTIRGFERDGVTVKRSEIVGMELLEALPVDRKEEEKTLAELRMIRARHKEHDRGISGRDRE